MRNVVGVTNMEKGPPRLVRGTGPTPGAYGYAKKPR